MDIQQRKDEDFINEDMMKYAPSIEKMQNIVRKKLKKHIEENDQQL